LQLGVNFLGGSVSRRRFGSFLEDNDRRLQRRMTTMLGAQKEAWPKSLTYATTWPRLANGGSDLIREWIGKTKKPRLIIIDILEKVRERVTNKQTTAIQCRL